MYDASLATQVPAQLPTQLARYAWIAVLIVWLPGALLSKPTVRTESRGRRLSELVIVTAAFALLFNPVVRQGPLSSRVLPGSGPIPWAGVLLTFAGVAFSIWARFLLGGNWSAAVTVKHAHTLVCSGPYAIVRHPIYSGFILAALGTAIAFGEAGCFLAPPLLAFSWRRKSRLEEDFMRAQFGAEYLHYSERVKALIPFVW